MKILITCVVLMILAAAGGVISALVPSMGRSPDTEQRHKFAKSPQYRDGKFHNEALTPMVSGSKGRMAVMWDFLFKKSRLAKPDHALPYVNTDLGSIDTDKDVIVWLGHSSWYLQLDGKRILIDPVLSDHAAPFSFMNKSFIDYYPWQAQRMPKLDYVLISHDHYDHLDYETMQLLQSRIGQIITPLGVGTHLLRWGFVPEQIVEADWNQQVVLDETLTLHVLPARHFSGRGFEGNPTLWASFLLQSSQRRLYYSGDSGYGTHFKKIGDRFGPIDVAILENGQYDSDWQYIHMLPEETVQAALDLNAAAVLPSHAGRFVMAKHSWNEPFIRLALTSRDKPYRLLTPKLGEVVWDDGKTQQFDVWWN
ncbi:MBL fold metallo-hydrolase [Hafnia paralvei]|uniref:MBL fold metallo-hydrolase n=1 Tax=Hafnia paralvei TaxID=546367 RepID=UPI001F27E60B|nr:MBL fold metallo-hydrolase [Hafnia paralvei]MCE9880208.1 MBL fold metallo-hydrolase [Hafnia paralvei]MCE9908887.1 MBL fold metallo-hydrolase [Hafnia paralvei]MCE9911677.1 MBL fold metallo-hydrolase [Hafnia paralvei]